MKTAILLFLLGLLGGCSWIESDSGKGQELLTIKLLALGEKGHNYG